MNIIRRNWLLILILCIGLFFRLYRITSTMTFLEDEGRDMLIVKKMVDTKVPVLIGPQTSMGNMYLGPLYYYLISPSLILANMDPVGPAIFIALTGVLTIWLLYKISNKWFGKWAAVLASFLYAVMPMVVSFSRSSWNPNLVPLISLVSIYLLDIILFHKKDVTLKHWLGLGATFGLLVQLHYMTLIFIFFEVLIIFISYIRTLKVYLKGMFIGLAGTLLILSPFILFELRNNFVNTRAIQKFIIAKDEHAIRYELPLWLWQSKVIKTANTGIGNTLGKGFFVKDDLRGILTAVFVFYSILIAIFGKRLPNKGPYLLPVYLLLAPILGLGIYQENIHPHYLAFIFPVIPLIFAAGFKIPKLRIVTIIFLIFMLYWFTPTLFSYVKSGPTLQKERAKKVAEYIFQESKGKDYNVVSRSGTFTTPYQYYLSLQPHPPSVNLENTLFVICQDSPCEESDYSTTLLYLAGPAHPSLAAYLAHPAINEFKNERRVVKEDHVFAGVWVGELSIVK